ncbi:hypothetical protein GCM10020256_43930 [Streptomyces thermocoprophilus]
MRDAFTVETAEVPAQVVIRAKRHGLADELPTWIAASPGRLEAAARDCGAATGRRTSSTTAMCPWTATDSPSAVCRSPTRRRRGRGRSGTGGRGGTTVRREPARRLAYTRISKSQVAFPQILAAFEAGEAWIGERGPAYDGPCREVCFAEWEAVGPEDPACDVAFPVG